MTFGRTIEMLMAAGHGLRARGFFNVEGGSVGLANKFYAWCDCSSFVTGPTHDCKNCGRKFGDYASVNSGDGDGIYVVAEILETLSEQVVGAFAVFDYQFQIANWVKTEIEKEQVPTYPLDLALQFSTTRPIVIGHLNNTGTVYFADGGSGLGSDSAIVDVQIDSEISLNVFSFAEDVSSDPEDWAARLSETQGMDFQSAKLSALSGLAGGQSLFESLGISEDFTFPSFVPRVLMILDESLSSRLNLENQIIVDDWKKLGAQFAASTVTSHIQPMHVSTVWINALLAREWDRAEGEVISPERSLELLFDVWTWAYQGVILGDEDCKRMIRENCYRATPMEISELLRRRGLYEAADKAARGELPDIEPDDVPASSPIITSKSSGLTKKSSGLGVTKKPSVDSTPGQARFCANCGKEFVSDTAKFCSDCGAARN